MGGSVGDGDGMGVSDGVKVGIAVGGVVAVAVGTETFTWAAAAWKTWILFAEVALTLKVPTKLVLTLNGPKRFAGKPTLAKN